MKINCKGQLIDLSTPKVMGILNITPDSFYDGGNYTQLPAILKHVETLLLEGATFIDVGAYSSRPNAPLVSEQEELQRLTPIVEALLKEFPNALLSIDTFRSSVAKTCVAMGAALINDISAGMLDPEMLKTIAQLQVPYIMMHMRGTPQDMHTHTTYEHLINEVIYYFSERLNNSKALGIIDVIIDPGFGFSKTTAQNYQLLHQLEFLNMLEKPLLVGFSRKSMIYNVLETTPAQALNGTSVLHTVALQKGAKILRVHDVKEAVECIKLTQKIEQLI